MGGSWRAPARDGRVRDAREDAAAGRAGETRGLGAAEAPRESHAAS